MNHAGHDQSAEAITAVELSAEDLMDMSQAIALGCSQAQKEPFTTSETGGGAALPNVLVAALRNFSASRQLLRGLSACILGLGIVASIAMGAHYLGVHYAGGPAEPKMETPAIEWTPIPDRAEFVEVEEEAPPPPTLFVNPFDETEVFELPPGIGQDEARRMVAELLLERARERAR